MQTLCLGVKDLMHRISMEEAVVPSRNWQSREGETTLKIVKAEDDKSLGETATLQGLKENKNRFGRMGPKRSQADGTFEIDFEK